VNGNGNGQKKKRRKRIIIISAIVLVFVLIAGAAVLYSSNLFGAKTNPSQPTPSPSNKPGGPGPTPSAPPKPEMVKIEGGTFQMGLNDVPTKSLYDLSQTPARSVSVNTFWIDKTEVTNAE